MSRRAPFTDLPSLLAWLDELRPADRVHLARLLADRATTGDLARYADATVYEMTRAASREAAAMELDMSVRAIQRAITNHIARTGAERRRGPERKPSPALPGSAAE